jgi:hypothetical protein
MAVGSFTCTVVGAQVDTSTTPPTISIILTDIAAIPAFTRTAFPFAAAPREMLAIALAAISTGSQVQAVLDPATFGPILMMFLFTS